MKLRVSGAAALIAAGMLLAPAGAGAHQRLTVRTDKGKVRGFTADGADKFLGIPYAAPPVGALRWRPPAPAAIWHGVRAATSYGNRCPQLRARTGPARRTRTACTSTSSARPARPRRRTLPVLVLIHGGGLVNGAGDQHDGALLARTNGIVVVSFNYRLGVFGFLALPSLSAEAADHASGDYGLLDQQAALRWVHRNIAAFGGDPRRVTIDGESAGGWSVCAQLASPLMRGLFQRARSSRAAAAPASRWPTRESAAATTFAATAGCSDPPPRPPACARSRRATLLATTAGTLPTATDLGRPRAAASRPPTRSPPGASPACR